MGDGLVVGRDCELCLFWGRVLREEWAEVGGVPVRCYRGRQACRIGVDPDFVEGGFVCHYSRRARVAGAGGARWRSGWGFAFGLLLLGLWVAYLLGAAVGVFA